MLQNRWRLVSVALIGVIGIIAGLALAAQGESEVRVAAIRHGDGDVEVALQQRTTEGWSERQLPTHRILRAESSGEWLVSSAVVLAVTTSDESMSDSEADGSAALFCVVHHGQAEDPFWQAFNNFLGDMAADTGLDDVEIYGKPNSADHAAQISDCARRGARIIATSIPDQAALQDALLSAKASGSVIISFNSGADSAAAVGSAVHFGLNDSAAGRLAGDAFNDAGVNSTVLCVVHEADNSGLHDRCNGLEDAYDGVVERVMLAATAVADPESAATDISEAAAAHDAGAVLLLNPIFVAPALTSGIDASIGVVGFGLAEVQLLLQGNLLFAIPPGEFQQAMSLMQWFLLSEQSPAFVDKAFTSSGVLSGAQMLLTPIAFDRALMQSLAAAGAFRAVQGNQ